MFDTRNQVDNRALYAAMKSIKNNSALASSNAFINGLLTAQFLLPAQIPLFTDPAGNRYIMVFTDWDQMRIWPDCKPDHQTVVQSYPDMITLVRERSDLCSGFVINPFSQNVIISKKTISRINGRLQKAAGVSSRPEEQDTKEKQPEQILLGDPKIFPLGLAVALRTFMQDRKDVLTAYLMLMMRGERQSYLVVVDCTGDFAELFSAMEDLCRQYLTHGMTIDFVPAESSLGQYAMNGRTPFFTKWKK